MFYTVKRVACAALTFCVMTISGCAIPLPPKFSQLPSDVASASVTIGQAGGYQITTSVAIPPDVCAQDGYIAGFQRGFINNWNPVVSSKESMFSMRKSPSFTYNWGLYHGKSMVAGDDVAANKIYGPSKLFDENQHTRCAAVAFMKGQNRGLEFSQAQLKLLENQEK